MCIVQELMASRLTCTKTDYHGPDGEFFTQSNDSLIKANSTFFM